MTVEVFSGTRPGVGRQRYTRDEDPVSTQLVAYDCPAGHTTQVVFAADVEQGDLPPSADCRTCFVAATRRGGRPEAPQRTARGSALHISHFDHVRARRTEQQAAELMTWALGRAAAARRAR